MKRSKCQPTIFFLLFLVGVSTRSTAQVTYQMYEGNGQVNYSSNSDICPWDSSLVIGGVTSNGSAQFQAPYLIKRDINPFKKLYSDTNYTNNHFTAIDAFSYQSSTGIVNGIVGAGRMYYPYIYRVVETDKLGIPQKETHFGYTNHNAEVFDIKKLSSGNTVLLGKTRETGANPRSYSTIVLFDPSYNIIWLKNLGSNSDYELALSVVENGGSIIVTGTTLGSNNNKTIYFLEITESSGQITKSVVFDVGSAVITPTKIINNYQGSTITGYTVVGQTNVKAANVSGSFVITLDLNFYLTKHRFYYDFNANNAVVFNDIIFDKRYDHYIVAGTKYYPYNLNTDYSNAMSQSLKLSDLSPTGGYEYGDNNINHAQLFNSVHLDTDGQYIFTGNNPIQFSTTSDIYEVKTNPGLSSGCHEAKLELTTTQARWQRTQRNFVHHPLNYSLSYPSFPPRPFPLIEDVLCYQLGSNARSNMESNYRLTEKSLGLKQYNQIDFSKYEVYDFSGKGVSTFGPEMLKSGLYILVDKKSFKRQKVFVVR